MSCKVWYPFLGWKPEDGGDGDGLLAHAAPDVSAGVRGWRCDTVELLLRFEKRQHQIVV